MDESSAIFNNSRIGDAVIGSWKKAYENKKHEKPEKPKNPK